MADYQLGDLVTDGIARFVVLGRVEQDAEVHSLTIGAELSTYIGIREGNYLVARFDLKGDYPRGYLNCVYPDRVTRIKED